MPHTPFSPPLTAPEQLHAELRREGFAVLDAATVRTLAGVSGEQLEVIAGLESSGA